MASSARHPVRLFLLGLLCLSPCWTTPTAAAPAVDVGENFRSADLTTAVDILEDPSNQLTLEQVTQSPLVDEFKPVRSDELRRASTSSTHWLRFALSNPLAEARVLTLQVRTQNAAAIAAYDGETHSTLSLRLTPNLQLFLPPASRHLYYLRVAPGGLFATQLELRTLDDFMHTYRLLLWLDGARQGTLVGMVVLALILSMLRRDSSYIWLAGHGFFFQVYQYLYNAEFGSMFFQLTEHWSNACAQAMLLIASTCGLRLAQRLPVYAEPSLFLRSWLQTLVIGNLLALPVLFFIPTLYAAGLILGLSATNVLFSIGSALYTFLLTYQKKLLYYALIRLGILVAVTAGALTLYSGGGVKIVVVNLLPFAVAAETAGLLCLLLWRSSQQQRRQMLHDREIAVLEAEGRVRTEMTAEVGHRIRTPVSGVLGMLEMLQDTPLSATQLDSINTIRRAGNELLNVVNELGDISKLETLPAELQQTTFDPQALVAECVDGFHGLASSHHLELISDPALGLPAYVSGDPTRLRQIVLQLLHYVVSHHEHGEVIVQIRSLPQQHWLRFQVNANAGTAATPLGGERDRRHPTQANGVRLAIARQLVDTLGGHIDISTPATAQWQAWFDLQLPQAGRVEQAVVDQEPLLRGKQILVVDDSATFCEVLRRQAGHWGMTVYTATSASEGLARLRNQITLGEPIQALLLDADMPEFTDDEWLQRLNAEIKPAPVLILLASRPELADSARLYQLGVRRVLLKPINHTSLKITLAEELNQRAHVVAQPALAQQPIRCLVAEDNIINTKVLTSMLNKLGANITTTSNGQEAVEACQREDFDIILMDCDMPVMDGWEATARIREMHRNRSLPPTPIIALTANTLDELGERARQPLMDAHLVKPIHLQELRLLLERWTGKSVAPTPTAES